MPILLECPTCTQQIHAPDDAGGQRVQCPHCDGLMTVPVMDERPRKRPSLREDDDDDDRATRRRPARRRDDDDDRPRRRSSLRDDDDDDDRPHRRKSTGMSQNVKTGLMVGGGVAVLLILVGLLWALGVFKKSGSGSVKGGPPAGWSVAAADTFNCYMLGMATKTFVSFNGRQDEWDGNKYEAWSSHNPKETFEINSTTFPVKVGTTEAELLAAFKKVHAGGIRSAPWNRLVSRNLITVNGLPCVEERWDYNENWMQDQQAERERELDKRLSPQAKATRDRMKQDAKTSTVPKNTATGNQENYVVRILANGSKLFVLTYSARGAPIDESNLKIFFDSFESK